MFSKLHKITDSSCYNNNKEVLKMLVVCEYCGKEFPDGEVIELKPGIFCCDKCLEKGE